ncbi:MAG: winged helix-turn-helix domain-containing protein, partial [Nitrososphaera sp.]|nr:winged helix-turn-helix domain-containing protein [Nitrososphaera sp.]
WKPDDVLTQDMQSDIRRDKLDIILRILEVGNTPVKKTHILYKAGINFYQLSRYLDLLLRTGMMEEITTPFVAYRTTEKGRVLMKLFSSVGLEATPAMPNEGSSSTASRSVKSARQSLGPEGFF